MMRRAVLLLLLAPLLQGLPALAGESFHGTPVGRGNDYARDFSLTDHDGRPRRLADFRGKAVLLFFGYLQCPNYCPLTLARLAEVMQLLGEDARRLQVIFITLDPERARDGMDGEGGAHQAGVNVGTGGPPSGSSSRYAIW